MLNELFSIRSVNDRSGNGGEPIDRALRMAKARGWNQSRFALELSLSSKENVSPQQVHNWIKRGMPPEWHEPVSNLLECSVDELLGRKRPPPPPGSAARWPFPNIPFKDFDNLSPAAKADIAGMVEDRIRRLNPVAGRKQLRS